MRKILVTILVGIVAASLLGAPSTVFAQRLRNAAGSAAKEAVGAAGSLAKESLNAARSAVNDPLGAADLVGDAALDAAKSTWDSVSGGLGSAWDSIASGDVCNDIKDAIKIIDCGSEDTVSFSDFKGGLSAPTAKDLDASLTRATSLREFIVNTVNFILTFLGIVSFLVVLYGGILYVTSAGNEEQSGKGKKAITYAVIGIFIIIGSFALVNTLLTFGGGTATDRGGAPTDVRGAGQEGSNIGQQVIYNMGASEINSSLNVFVNAYKNLTNTASYVNRLKTMAKPLGRPDYPQYWTAVTNAVNQIKTGSNSLSKTRMAAQNLIDGWLSETAAKGIESKEFENGKIKDKFIEAVEKVKLVDAVKEDFKNAIAGLIGDEKQSAAGEEIKGKLLIVRKTLGDIANIPASQSIENAKQRGLITEKDISRAFAGIDPNITVDNVFTSAIDSLEAARTLADSPQQTELVIDVVKNLDRLYLVVKDIQFVFVKITASSGKGSAPMIVELNGLGSRDPTGQTIPDENYKWDPDGDGKDGVAPSGSKFPHVECSRDTGPTIACTYNKPGTYMVRLSIVSQDPARIANGQAFKAIVVEPSISRINLKAIVGSVSTDLKKYEQDSNGTWQPLIDKSEFQVTTAEARENGVSFDASESKSGDGGDLTFYEWTFGDATQPEKGETKNKIDRHKYSREGKFLLKLEVTDSGRRKDRKLVNIVVAAVAARIETTKEVASPDELVEFDGSPSRSDAGPITSYEWSILNQDKKDILNFQNELEIVGGKNGSVLRVKFKKPGSYVVKLKISDGSRQAETEVQAAIKSRKPRANFSVLSCPLNCPDPKQPSLVVLDASNSFDPDKNDVLTYKWHFFNELGDELKPPTQFTVIPATAELESQNAKKLKVKFPKVAKYTVRLVVNDSHTDTNILQEDTLEKTVDIKSTVEASWADNIESVKKLTDGSAKFSLKGTVSNAKRVRIDFGDGESNEQTVNLNASGFGNFDFEHEYKRSGTFLVTLKAESEEGNGENTITKRLYVSGGDSPLAAIEAFVDGIAFVMPDATVDNQKPALEIIRKKTIKFDASSSVNSKGESNKTSAEKMKFSWDFGDTKRTTGEKAEHSYEEISPAGEPYAVTLTATDGDKTSQATFYVRVVSKKPTVSTLSLEKKTSGELTPVDVELTAENAIDPDGKITNFQFWYYDPRDKDTKLSVVDTTADHAVLTVETIGEANEEHEYIFCVNATDNENTTVTCEELFEESALPKLKVKNGANKAPNASFTANRTTARVNEPVTFTSGSKDEDGRIIKYIWDLSGDGFQNDNPTELSTVTHRYERRSPEGGYRVKLKVIDDRNASGFSKEIPIYIEAKSQPPKASFNYQVLSSPPRRVKFTNTSTADSENGARIVKWKWDFDTSREFDFTCNKTPKPRFCNNDKGDDEDSAEQNPIFDYPATGNFQVRLWVEDSDGNVSEPISTTIKVIGGTSGGTGAAPNAQILKAQLRTYPQAAFVTVPNTNPPVQQKELRINANENGKNVTLFWGDSTGDIVSYRIDKNIWCNSDGNSGSNNRADDKDNPESNTCIDPATNGVASNCWAANYQRYANTGHPKGYGRFTTQLTVTDRNGETATDQVEIIFDGTTDSAKVIKDGCEGKPQNLLGGSLFKDFGAKNTILLSLLSGVIVILIAYEAAGLLRKGKRRNI